MNIFSSSVQGMQNNLQKYENHARRISRVGTNDDPASPDGISLPEEMVGMRLSQRGFEANAVVFRAEDEMMGTLLDTFA